MKEICVEKPVTEKATWSAELDHFYVTDLTPDFEADVNMIARKFEHAYIMAQATRHDDETMSTVHMPDGYHMQGHTGAVLRPVDVLKRLITGAERAEVPLDYLLEEGGFVSDSANVIKAIRKNVPPWKNVIEAEEWLYAESRTYFDTGEIEYLFGPIADDRRAGMAMHSADQPESRQYFALKHRIQLFNYKRNKKGTIIHGDDGEPIVDEWSCPLLAAQSVMARLGMRQMTPEMIDKDNLPDYDRWSSYPAVMQLNPNAAPFQAEHTFNILPTRYLAVETATKVIIESVERGAGERLSSYCYSD